ncbi:MAG: pilus assembly protein CpaE [Microbacteriaceae bacterium]|jgi:pilus assembly protein CpaE|nr:pilus assembly protein CpaE [Microbacteriaceae bacterium]
MSRLVLISRSREYESRMQDLVGSNLTSVAGAYLPFGTDIVLEQIEDGEQPEIAFLGPFLSYEDTNELSAGLRLRFPGIVLVLVHENHEVIEEWVSAMGVHAVLSPTADDSAVIDLLVSLHEWLVESGLLGAESNPVARDPRPNSTKKADAGDAEDTETEAAEETESAETETEPAALETVATAEGERAQVIAVVSPKGGQGKTTVATNLAVGLAKLAPNSVVLVDADMQFGDVATVLALEPAHSLPDMVRDLAPRDPMVLKTFLTPHSSGFFVVCGSESPADGDAVSGEQLAHLVQQLSEIFRYVIIDTSPGLGEHALAAVEQATDAVVLCSMSVQSIRGLRKELAVLSSIGIMPASRHVVLNFEERASGLSRHDVELTVGVPVDISIPRSNAIALSTNRGVPILQSGTHDPAAKALNELVARFGHTGSAAWRSAHGKKAVA